MYKARYLDLSGGGWWILSWKKVILSLVVLWKPPMKSPKEFGLSLSTLIYFKMFKSFLCSGDCCNKSHRESFVWVVLSCCSKWIYIVIGSLGAWVWIWTLVWGKGCYIITSLDGRTCSIITSTYFSYHNNHVVVMNLYNMIWWRWFHDTHKLIFRG